MNISDRVEAVYRRAMNAVCRSSFHHPLRWLLGALMLCIPAWFMVQKIGLDTDLVRLLPTHSRAATWTRQLANVTGDGGYFTVVLEGRDRESLAAAREELTRTLALVPGVDSVAAERPVDFINRYRYLLVAPTFLRKISAAVVRLQGRLNPFAMDLDVGDAGEAGSAGDASGTKAAGTSQQGEESEIKDLLERYGEITRYYDSEDGLTTGLFVRPKVTSTDIAATRALFQRIKVGAAEAGRRHGLAWTGVGGGHADNLLQYDTIIADVGRAGLISGVSILLLLALSFRSVLILPVLLYPLGVGLLCAYSLVPFVVGTLNLITSFLLMVLFGIGIEFSIHLVKRFQLELHDVPPDQALEVAFDSTGLSVISSGLTTSLPMFVLAFLDFKGFSEFGLVGGGSMIAVLCAVLLLLPAAITLGHRLGVVRPAASARGRGWLPHRAVTVALLAGVVVASVVAWTRLEFDYDFNNLSVNLPETEYKARAKRVFRGSFQPGAVFVAPDLATLDASLAVFRAAEERPDSLFERSQSIRDFALTPEEAASRLEIVEGIREEVRGSWVKKIADPRIREQIRSLLDWEAPAALPSPEEVPESIRRPLTTRDGTGRPVLGIWPAISRRDGRQVMAFTEQLYGLPLPKALEGPQGEVPVSAEIQWMVKKEGPRVVAITIVGIVLIVYLSSLSVPATLLIMFPLLGGVVLSLGVLPFVGLKLNFFNVVAIPAILGMAVDNGVHYYHRWRAQGRDAAAVQGELFGSVSVCTIANMLGYFGLIFTRHPGLRSIGYVACLGMVCLWATSLLLMPGLLGWRRRPPQPS